MNIRQKVLVAPVIACLFLVVLGVLTLTALRQEHHALESIYSERFKQFATASAEFKAIYRIHANTYRVFTWLSNLSDEQVNSASKEIAASVEKATVAMKRLASNPSLLPEEQAALTATINTLQAYGKQVNDALDMASMDPNVGMASMQTADETFHKLDDEFEKLVALESTLSQQEYERAGARSQQTTVMAAVLLIIALTTAVAISLIMARRIVSSVNLLRSTIVGIQQSNDLTQRAVVMENDEIGQMSTAFNHLLDSFKSIIHRVTDSASEVSSWAHKVSDAAEDIADGAAHQGSATSLVAASVEEITVSIQEVSRHAEHAKALTLESEEISSKGAKTINEAFQEIQKISSAVNKSSQTLQELDNEVVKISEIVNVIKDVAEQTNLLALNAAIEAARAGEQGRGFAVVADEVKKLAQHTSTSTKEIASMIAKVQATASSAVAGMDEGVALVSSGVRLAADALNSIQAIKAKSDNVVSTVGDISFAITEQSSAMNSMAESIERIATMTDRTTSATTDASESSKRLLALSEHMFEDVKRFTA